MSDSADKLNFYMNQQLELAVARTNNEVHCGLQVNEAERELYEVFYDQVGGYLWAAIENKVTETNYVETLSVTKNNSIYRDLNWINAFVLKFAELGVTLNLNGHIIGSDKLGHFVGIGWQYFKTAVLKKEGIEQAISHGHLTEQTFFGEMTTGVYSFADLAVNYDGYIFWSHLFNSKASPSNDPYIACNNGKLVKLREFRWAEYVTDAWDEAVNCNAFRNRDIKRKIENQILKLEKSDPENKYQCPVKSCVELKGSYPESYLNC